MSGRNVSVELIAKWLAGLLCYTAVNRTKEERMIATAVGVVCTYTSCWMCIVFRYVSCAVLCNCMVTTWRKSSIAVCNVVCHVLQYTILYYLAPSRKPFCNSQMCMGSCGEMNTGKAVSWSISSDGWCHMMPIQQKETVCILLCMCLASTFVSHISSITCHKIEMMTGQVM